MFSNGAFILLTVQLIKLKFFKKQELTTINEITEVLISKKVKPNNIYLWPMNSLLLSLRILTIFSYLGIGYFLVMCLTEDIIYAMFLFFQAILDNALILLSCVVSAVISFLLIKVSNFFVKKMVLKLQEEVFDTNQYIEKLSDLLEPYQSLELLKLLNNNKSNLFGLVVLQFILVCIELDYIKHSDLYFKPFVFLRKSI